MGQGTVVAIVAAVAVVEVSIHDVYRAPTSSVRTCREKRRIHSFFKHFRPCTVRFAVRHLCHSQK